jgi:hypothetical protein
VTGEVLHGLVGIAQGSQQEVSSQAGGELVPVEQYLHAPVHFVEWIEHACQRSLNLFVHRSLRPISR